MRSNRSYEGIRCTAWTVLACCTVLALPLAAAAEDLSIADASGDTVISNALLDVPFGGPVAISGDQIDWIVPDFLMPEPIDRWLVFSHTGIGTPVVDRIPDSGLLNGTGGTVGDMPDPMLDGNKDLLTTAILESGTDNTFRVSVRDLADPTGGPPDFTFGVDYENGPPEQPDRYTGIEAFAPSADGFLVYVSYFGETPMPFTPSSYYDVVSAEMEIQPTQLVVTLELAGDIPPVLPEIGQNPPYSPHYRINLDVDGEDAGTGDPNGTDRLYSAYFAPNGTFTGTTRVFNGDYMELQGFGLPTVGRNQNLVTITIPLGGVPFEPELFRWSVAVDLVVSEPSPADADDYWYYTTDTTASTSPLIFRDDFEDGDLTNWN